MRSRSVRAFIYCAALVFLTFDASAQPGGVPVGGEARGARAPVGTAIAEGEAESVARVNAWTVGVVGGMIEGAPIRFATDLQIALDDGDDLRVLPIVSRGAKQNVIDLLYLKGVDAGVVYTDVFDEFRREGKIRNIDKRINYISHLFLSGVHVLVRPEIRELKDLEGKKFGFQGRGTGVSVTSAILFNRMGINVEPVYITNNQALEKMKTGEMHGLIYLVTKAHPSLTAVDPKFGFHLLSIPYEKFTDYYVPMTFENSDYPNLVKPDEKVEAIGVPAVLAVYNWPKNSDRFRKVERFIKYYFDRFDRFKQPPFQKEWKEINLAATVPGWNRYWLADQMLKDIDRNRQAATGATGGERMPTNSTSSSSTSSSAVKLNAPVDRREYNEFLEWKRQQQKQ
jgi:TRAP-type uncharacterized transport system substrate-binding protein